MSRLPRHAALFGVLLLVPAVGAAQQAERFTLDGPEVAVYNLAGTMRVEGSTGGSVVVEVTRAGADAARLSMATGAVRGRQALRVVYPSDRIVYARPGHHDSRSSFQVNDDGTFGDGGMRDARRHRVEIVPDGDGVDAHADVRVLVPRGRRVFVRSGVGEATIENVDGQLDVSVAASRTRASHVRGSLRLETGSGGVEVTDVTGDLRLESGSGGATLDGVRGGALDVDVGSGSLRGRTIDVSALTGDIGSGGVRLSDVRTPRLHLETGSGGSDVELVGPVDEVFIEAGSGGVTLRMPASTGGTVDIETGSGGIQSDFDVKARRVERRSLHGTIGDGRARIHVEAGSGTVRLLKN